MSVSPTHPTDPLSAEAARLAELRQKLLAMAEDLKAEHQRLNNERASVTSDLARVRDRIEEEQRLLVELAHRRELALREAERAEQAASAAAAEANAAREEADRLAASVAELTATTHVAVAEELEDDSVVSVQTPEEPVLGIVTSKGRSRRCDSLPSVRRVMRETLASIETAARSSSVVAPPGRPALLGLRKPIESIEPSGVREVAQQMESIEVTEKSPAPRAALGFPGASEEREPTRTPSAEASLSLTGGRRVLMVGIAALVAGVLGMVGVDRLRSATRMERLARAVAADPGDSEAIEAALAAGHDSPLDRFNDRRDYLVASAIARRGNSDKNPSGEPLGVALKNVKRAVERAPANVWYRITQARLATATGDNRARDEAEDAIARLATSEPLALHERLERALKAKRTDEALLAARSYMAAKPTATAATLQQLANAGVAPSVAITAAPDSPDGLVGTTEFLAARRLDWKSFAMTALATLESRSGPEAQAARASLYERTDRLAEATVSLASAIRAEPRREWRLSLARLHGARREWDESRRLLDELLREPVDDAVTTEARRARRRLGEPGGPPPAAN